MPANELLLTGDDSHTLRSHRFGVAYHSHNGALAESRHVFLTYGVEPLLEAGRKRLDVLEVGLGTGLNALLVRDLARRYPGSDIHYLAYELFPIDPEEATALNYCGLLGLPASDLADLHQLPFGQPRQLEPNFTFTVRQADFLGADAGASFTETADLIFYDAFAPVTQPEFWTVDALRQCYDRLRPGGYLVTYCAKGQVKRNFREAGFRVEPLLGPPGKREMTRAVRPEG